jgi:transcriptional regulator with XRE-family HTH domain
LPGLSGSSGRLVCSTIFAYYSIMVEIDRQIAGQLKALRGTRGWTLEQLAEASGVSRAMISKIERTEASATAALLSRLAVALDVPLSDLLAPPEVPAFVSRRADRPRWQDPQTGFIRETVSPPLTGSSVEIVEVQLPPHAQVDYGMPAPPGYAQHVIALTGHLRIEQDQATDLGPGDALYMVPGGEFSFRNTGSTPCRYLVVMERSRRAR